MIGYLHTTFVIARNTFRESVRDRIFYAIVAFALIFLAFTVFLGSISLGEHLHIIRTLGLAGIYFFGLLIAIFLGISLVYKEIERRTLYFVLSKPVSRGQVILGKFFGLYVSVALSVIGMALVYLAIVAQQGGGFDGLALIAITYELAELTVVVALSTFFSSFARPLPSALYAILVVYIGHSLSLLEHAVRESWFLLRTVVGVIGYLLPNLEKFSVREIVIAGGRPSLLSAEFAAAYALLYVALLLYIATLLLRRRDL